MTDFEFPEAYQDLFIPARYKVFHGGRGSAKSWSFARALVIAAVSGQERILCSREFQSSMKDSVKQLIADQINAMGFGGVFRILRNDIHCLLTGSTFVFYGLRHSPGKIKSLEGITKTWVEEADTISKDSLEILIPTIRADDSEIWFSFNRRSKKDPVDEMFIGSPPRDGAIIRQVNFDENPFFTKTLQKEMEYDRKHDHEKFRHVWLGEPVVHSEALVFSKNWRIDGSIHPKEGEILYYGADWGFANDPTVLLRCWADHEKRIIYVDQEAYGVGVEIDNTPALFDKVPESRKWAISADSARPETISYMKRHGFRVKAVKKGKGSIEEGVNFLKSYTIVVHDRCKHLIDELSLYSWKTDPLTGEILPILVDKYNNCIDALRYALEKLAFKRSMIHIG